MASDQHPLDSFLAAARGALAHLHLPIHIPGSDPAKQRQQQQQRQPDCLLHLHVVLTNFLHKPLRSFSRCFGNDDKPKRGRSKQLPLLDTGKKHHQQQQLELLLCIAFDALAHNLQVLEGACKQKGEEFGSAALQMDQFQVVRKVIVGKKADFDGFISNLGFARVGAPPASFVDDSPASAPPATSQEGPASVTGEREGVDSGGFSTPQPPQKFAGRLLNIPLSNVERLRSTLSTVSLTELIELVPQLVGRLSTSGDSHPDKKKLFSVQDFFRYTEFEGKRFFEELDRDGDGQVTLEDLEVAMRKRRLPRRYARDLLRRTRSNFFSKSIGWKQFLSLMEQKEATILRAYTTLCLSKSGTLQKNQILESLKGAGLPANEDHASAMLRYLNADSEGSISYSHFRSFMLLLPSERLEDDPRNIWFEAATLVAIPPPVEISTGNVLKSALAGGLASALSTSMLHPIDTMKTRVQASTLSFPELISKLPQIGIQGLYRGSIPAILGQFSSHGLRTGIFEASKLILVRVAPTLPEIQVQSLASFCSTILGTVVRIPCEVLKQRLQAGIFDNVGEAIVGTMQKDGIRGFFRGTGATLCREVPFYVAGMCLYGEAKKAAQHVLSRDLEPWETIAVGALSGGLAAVVTTPFDVMKTRMMTAPPGTPVSMQLIVLSILRNEGPLGLFKGAIPRFFWIAPLGAMNFAGYELAKKAMIEAESEPTDSLHEKKTMVGARG
ncbi:mitochondrial substrate carrier family protein C-like [Lolium rigidum]|uniref:mitochondrial substrate carrier family protein C-like n=1 Tax=Lolium rigidum TaxID=89674 RepID=UPI001F5D1ADD|nr:mitochondrial substrate carrier family protein C-like [Lolium rigidum]